MLGTLNAMRREKAERVRDVLYIRELSEDDIDERISHVDKELNGAVDHDGYRGIPELANKISGDNDFAEEEINRILNSKKDLTFDEMLGIDE